MSNFEKHLRKGTSSHRSFLLPTEVKKTNNSDRKKNERNIRNKKRIMAHVEAKQARRECNRIYEDIVSLAESASAYGRELVRENASANSNAGKIIPLMEEAGRQIAKLAVEVVSATIPLDRLRGAIRTIGFVIRNSGRLSGNPKLIREALDVFIDLGGIIDGVGDLLHNINQISSYVDRVNKHTENAKAYDRELKRVEERGEVLIARYKQKGCDQHSDIWRVASKITMYKV
jgi:hypothetical protein